MFSNDNSKFQSVNNTYSDKTNHNNKKNNNNSAISTNHSNENFNNDNKDGILNGHSSNNGNCNSNGNSVISSEKSTSSGNNNNNNSSFNNHNGNNSNIHSNKNRICRDFVRGLCRRKHCRYPHVVSPDLVVFCHDYQNASCPRVNCKFLHYTLQEEEYYRKFGEFPQDFICDNSIPCKERVVTGSCRHRECYLNGNEPMWNGPRPPPYRPNDCPPPPSSLNDYRTSCEEFQAIKRSSRDVMDGGPFKRFREEVERIDVMTVIRRFEEEQIMLRRRVEANEIKIAELRASNEYLMAQNAQLRLSNVQQQQCSNVVNPVTVSQTTSQPQTPQVMGGVSIAPVQVQATPIVSIAAPPTQIITNSAQPLAIAAANTSQGQQLTIAANTSQGQQLAIAQQNITSLSNTTQQTLAPTHPQQILGTSQITLTPTLAQGPSMGLTINTSQALAMSNATQPIISYPVMTHSILPH